MLSIYDIAIYLGLYQLGWWLYRTVCLVLRTLSGTSCTTARYGRDSWAVVTGATGTMGKAICHHLAREGFNLVLISKTQDKLDRLSKELQELSKVKSGKPIQTKAIVHDLVKESKPEDFEKLYKEKLASLDISVLIHNASTGNQPGSFLETNEDSIHETMTVNTYPTVLLTQQVITGMKKRYSEKKVPSLIIHTSSITGLVPTPFAAVFSATKIFGDFMALGLQYELAQFKIDVCTWRMGEIAKDPKE